MTFVVGKYIALDPGNITLASVDRVRLELNSATDLLEELLGAFFRIRGIYGIDISLCPIYITLAYGEPNNKPRVT